MGTYPHLPVSLVRTDYVQFGPAVFSADGSPIVAVSVGVLTLSR
jgi:hypothetical protein